MSPKNSSSHQPAAYNDLNFRIIASFAGAYIVTEFGGSKPLLSQLLTKAFYIEFLASLLITFLIIFTIYRVTVYLDRAYPWTKKLPQRISMQIFLGIILPTVGTFLLAALYFAAYGVNILSTNYHLYALPFISLLITLFNAYYLVRYLLYHINHGGHQNPLVNMGGPGAEPLVKNAAAISPSTIPSDVTDDNREAPAPSLGQTSGKEIYIVNTPLKTIPLRMEDIACFYRSNSINYVRTYGQSVNEAYVISDTLKEVEDQVSPAQFFRINRQMIVSIGACVSYRNGRGKGLELVINPPYVDAEQEMKELQYVLVSEDRTPAFKAWIDR